MKAKPTFEEFRRAVAEMRAAQTNYFNARRVNAEHQADPDRQVGQALIFTLLDVAKGKERRVDDMLAQLDQADIQPSLFDAIEGEEANDATEDATGSL